MLQTVLKVYGLSTESCRVDSFGKGLINHTWVVNCDSKKYILQCINQAVFKKPQLVASNIRSISAYLNKKHPAYHFVSPIISLTGEDMIRIENEYYRLFPFVTASHSIEVVETPQQAYEAAAQFGKFTRVLNEFDVRNLNITIPHFHDLALRYQQFITALETGNKERIRQSEHLVSELHSYATIVHEYKSLLSDKEFKIRVTHHDTKISNVLFDEKDKGICVIDLDTVMPGYFISDVGDMMRTYLSPVSEEENDFSKIIVREDFYKAIVDGYSLNMQDVLTNKEKQSFFFAGKFMIYMQALRFLTDHLIDDIYYGAKYPGHNYVRANNQAVLLKELVKKEQALTNYGVNQDNP